MVTQQHENELPRRAQASSPMKEHRWREVLLSILGVALPLVAGSMVWWPWEVPDIFDSPSVGYTVAVATGLLALVGAFLLRSWWALLIVPVAWLGGELLAAVLRQLAEGSWPVLPVQMNFWAMGVAFVFIWAAVGTALGMWLKMRQQRR